MQHLQLRLDRARSLLQQAGVALPVSQGAPPELELQAIIDALCELSERDALTGLPNRRAFLGRLKQELDRSARAGETALLVMIDIDHFKSVNDRHGHAAGDAVLRAVADTLQSVIRPMDTVARLGGEEFGVVFPNCATSAGAALAERLRRTVQERPILLPDGLTTVHVTISAGGAYSPAWVRSTAEHWLERADRQLYMAKRQGRNRVLIEPVAFTEVSAEEKHLLFGWHDADGLIIDSADAV